MVPLYLKPLCIILYIKKNVIQQLCLLMHLTVYALYNLRNGWLGRMKKKPWEEPKLREGEPIIYTCEYIYNFLTYMHWHTFLPAWWQTMSNWSRTKQIHILLASLYYNIMLSFLEFILFLLNLNSEVHPALCRVPVSLSRSFLLSSRGLT